MSRAVDAEQELRINANQLFAGVIGVVLWILSLSYVYWVSLPSITMDNDVAPTVTGDLFSLKVSVDCAAIFRMYSVNVTRNTIRNTSVLEATTNNDLLTLNHGSWTPVCRYLQENITTNLCGLQDVIVSTPLAMHMKDLIYSWNSLCDADNARVQVAYLLITATTLSCIAFCFGFAFLTRKVL
jgi:hypothetical protein